MLNNSSQKARIFFPSLTFSTKWLCDPENVNFHQGAGASDDVIVEPTLATGTLSSRVRHSNRTTHKLNYLNIRTSHPEAQVVQHLISLMFIIKFLNVTLGDISWPRFPHLMTTKHHLEMRWMFIQKSF